MALAKPVLGGVWWWVLTQRFRPAVCPCWLLAGGWDTQSGGREEQWAATALAACAAVSAGWSCTHAEHVPSGAVWGLGLLWCMHCGAAHPMWLQGKAGAPLAADSSTFVVDSLVWWWMRESLFACTHTVSQLAVHCSCVRLLQLLGCRLGLDSHAHPAGLRGSSTAMPAQHPFSCRSVCEIHHESGRGMLLLGGTCLPGQETPLRLAVGRGIVCGVHRSPVPDWLQAAQQCILFTESVCAQPVAWCRLRQLPGVSCVECTFQCAGWLPKPAVKKVPLE